MRSQKVDQHFIADVMIMDLQKNFDKVSHMEFLKKLKAHRIKGRDDAKLTSDQKQKVCRPFLDWVVV